MKLSLGQISHFVLPLGKMSLRQGAPKVLLPNYVEIYNLFQYSCECQRPHGLLKRCRSQSRGKTRSISSQQRKSQVPRQNPKIDFIKNKALMFLTCFISINHPYFWCDNCNKSCSVVLALRHCQNSSESSQSAPKSQNCDFGLPSVDTLE